MTNTSWRINLHTTDDTTWTYTVSSARWEGDRRIGQGIRLMSVCQLEDLPGVLDSVADMVLNEQLYEGDLLGPA